ncbi:MAG: type IV toxin-antitoxin system AbiEi family antitoxin domain-containing protein [Gammaproteobacteria bacterium]
MGIFYIISTMTPLSKHIINSGQANHVLNDRQLARLLGGSDERRYGQVNRALNKGELLRVKRGLYVLADQYRDYPVHPYALAQQLMPGSYVSAETALSYHGWIPEAVRSVLSITAKGKSVSYEHDRLGMFEFRRMSVKPGYFLQGVTRYELQHQAALIADPMRALLDLVYLRKLPWQGLSYLVDGLRIDEQALDKVTSLSMTKLLDVYKGKREKMFIEGLLKGLGYD